MSPKKTSADSQNDFSSHLKVGMLVDGKYKVLNKIGQGGMSIVWLVMNERANKQWAIKEVRKDGVDNYEIVRQSLIAEVEYLKKLSHPNLPSIIDIIDTKNSLLIVMDYVEGISLSQALRERGALPQEQVVHWAKQLCAVLGYLHSRTPPIIYRDLKPANVMLQPNDTVKIIDFGTAREFKEGRVDDTVPLGTQGYAAPEQYGVHQTDARTDVYNLGATMYHLVTGHNPSEPPYVMHPIRKWGSGLSSGLEAIIMKCTRRDPDDRYQNMAELLFDLERFHHLDDEYIRSQNRKWRLFLVSAALTIVLAIGTIGFAVSGNIQTQNNYNALLEKGQSEYGVEKDSEVVGYYINAARLDPGNPRAYQEYLALIKRNQVMTEEENNNLRLLLRDTNSRGRTNLDILKSQNPAAHDELAYDLGILYYFGSQGDNGKVRAQQYLSTAANSAFLNEQKAALAARLHVIAKNYDLFLSSNTTGGKSSLFDDSFTARAFWEDLVTMSDGDLVEVTGNSFVSIGVYRELVYHISEHADILLKGGISLEEMNKQLEKATAGLELVVPQSDEETLAIIEIQETVDVARTRATMAAENNDFLKNDL
jgi:serine/threonine-protein kinase